MPNEKKSTKKKRNKKRNFFRAWNKCHGDVVKILERIGATSKEYEQWIKDPAFVERFETAVLKKPDLPDDAEGLLLLAKELPFFVRPGSDRIYAIAKTVAALPEKERTAFFQRLRFAEIVGGFIVNLDDGRRIRFGPHPDFRKKVQAKVKECLSGRFKPGFYSKKEKQIAQLICDSSLTDEQRAYKAGMNVSAFRERRSQWMKTIADLSSKHDGPLPSYMTGGQRPAVRIGEHFCFP
jgi:hypothetical protein